VDSPQEPIMAEQPNGNSFPQDGPIPGRPSSSPQTDPTNPFHQEAVGEMVPNEQSPPRREMVPPPPVEYPRRDQAPQP